MNGQRFARTVVLVAALGVAGAVLGCSAKDDGHADALKEALPTLDKHESHLNQLDAKAQKADQKSEQQAARLTELETKAQKADQQAARIAELEKQIAALKGREPAAGGGDLEAVLKEIAAELRNRPKVPPPDPEAALKYMHGVAEAFLTATLARNDQTMIASLTRAYKATIAGENKEGTENYFKVLSTWCYGRSGGPKEEDKAVYQEWKITDEKVAPGAEEASFTGTLSGGKSKATFTMRVVKDKESGKFLVDLFGVKHGE
jgi:hypothetical protein